MSKQPIFLRMRDPKLAERLGMVPVPPEHTLAAMGAAVDRKWIITTTPGRTFVWPIQKGAEDMTGMDSKRWLP